ncbi:MAG: alpha/beta hydrolase [Flavobacteriaceae bacterium]|nr:alpha/beta hydrolase [Flavobacteriaceae bacterium]
MNIKTTITAIFFIFSFSLGFSQDKSAEIVETLEGHWEGVFTKQNSHQKFDVQFYRKDSSFTSLQTIREWHPQFGEFEIPLNIDSLGTIRLNTGYGKALLKLDRRNLEMVGYIENSIPIMNVHLKKVPDPPSPNYEVNEIKVSNSDVSLNGHLHRPMYEKARTAIIVVGGRSCYAGSTKYDLTAKILREYGVAVLVFDKRGTGKSTGNCDIATIDDLASDVLACKRYLENHPDSFENIGVIGSSAGGWVMLKAQENDPFDFLIGVVGPSTSVKDQQLQSAEYGAVEYDLSDAALANLKTYTELLFEAKANRENFKAINGLLANAEKEGWRDLLDDTDIPDSVDAIDQLWVRRHNYDPSGTLKNLDVPLLSIFGEKDWIVPYKENIEALNQSFPGNRKKLLTTLVAPDAGHGTEVEGKNITFSDNNSYWRYFRISPQVTIEIIDFLKRHAFIE